MRHQRRLALITGAIVAAFAAAPAAQAAIVSCGDVITSSIRVDNNLTNCSGDGLVVGAHNITIDLYYKTIDGIGAGQGIDNTSGFDNVTIRRGTVQQFTDGVLLEDQVGGALENLNLRGNGQRGAGLAFTDQVRLRSLNATGNVFYGVHLAPDADDNVIHGGTFSKNGGHGLAIQFGSDGNRADDFDADDNALTGVYVRESTLNAIDFADMRRNGWDGLTLNSAVDTTVTRIDADENSLDGIALEPGTTGTTLSENGANDNTGRGISVEGPGNTIADNEANHNGDWGIFAVLGNTDGGGNEASGNGQPAECTGVVCS